MVKRIIYISRGGIIDTKRCPPWIYNPTKSPPQRKSKIGEVNNHWAPEKDGNSWMSKQQAQWVRGGAYSHT